MHTVAGVDRFGIRTVTDIRRARRTIDCADQLFVCRTKSATRIIRERRMRGVDAAIEYADDNALSAIDRTTRQRSVPDRTCADEFRAAIRVGLIVAISFDRLHARQTGNALCFRSGQDCRNTAMRNFVSVSHLNGVTKHRCDAAQMCTLLFAQKRAVSLYFRACCTEATEAEWIGSGATKLSDAAFVVKSTLLLKFNEIRFCFTALTDML